jgi:hypothetical protein
MKIRKIYFGANTHFFQGFCKNFKHIFIICSTISSLDLAISAGTFEASIDTPSQLMTQYSGGSQYTTEQKFLHKHEIMPLSRVINLAMVIFFSCFRKQ